jgi:DAK2 domain fusion protein YloV
MIFCAAAALEKNKQPINELNVFPVPDGDTGTNMTLTMEAAAAALRKKAPAAIGASTDAAASALLRGARGNSGGILPLLFRGFAKGRKGLKKASALDCALALGEGVDAAYKAVMKPTEGTILTVSKKAAAAATEFAGTGTDVELMFVCALEAARDALAETVEQNPVLKRVGVIDAGGRGYVVILEAMLASLRGEFTFTAVTEEAPVVKELDRSAFAAFSGEEILFTYCTELIIGKSGGRSAELLRAFLDSMGDSVVLVEDNDVIKTHTHTNDPGRILSEALRYGDLLNVKIENMREQHTGLSAAEPSEPKKPWGVVAVCAGAGMQNLFRELGVDRVVTGGQTMNPSTEDILREVNRTPAETVFIFPNNKNIIMAAEQCAPLTDKKVVVIPTTTVPQGVSAMLSMDPDASAETAAQSFREALARVRTALITYAARDSVFDGHPICAGEYLGLLDGNLLGSFRDMPALLQALAGDLFDAPPEFLSVYYGEDVSTADAEEVSGLLSQSFPDSELTLVNGGQPVYYYMISAE